MTVEPGGPAQDLRELRRFIGHWMTEGVQGVDYFYNLGDILWNPEQRPWFDANLPLVRLIGKYHCPRADVAVMYSGRTDRLADFPWDNFDGEDFGLPGEFWSRMQLETRIPQPHDILLDTDFARGNADKYRVILDAGTVIMEPRWSAHRAMGPRRRHPHHLQSNRAPHARSEGRLAAGSPFGLSHRAATPQREACGPRRAGCLDGRALDETVRCGRLDARTRGRRRRAAAALAGRRDRRRSAASRQGPYRDGSHAVRRPIGRPAAVGRLLHPAFGGSTLSAAAIRQQQRAVRRLRALGQPGAGAGRSRVERPRSRGAGGAAM